MTRPDGLILLSHLKVQNANAVSGPLTWGFPPVTAFTGFGHALGRRLGRDIALDGVGIVCHSFEPQTYRPNGRYYNRFCLTRNPLGKDAKSPSTVEEGRAHMEISLVLGAFGYLDEDEREELLEEIAKSVPAMRLAGGSIQEPEQWGTKRRDYIPLSEDQAEREKEFRRLARRLLPGFALVHRPGVLADYLAEIRKDKPESTVLDALLGLNRLNVEPVANNPEKPEDVTWEYHRARPGWLVPLPVGYGAISRLYEPGEVKNSRDESTPFRFVEALYSLGEWLSPLRLERPEELLWHHKAEPESGLYICDHIS